MSTPCCVWLPLPKQNVYKVYTNFHILRTQTKMTNDTMENTMGNGLMSDLNTQLTKLNAKRENSTTIRTSAYIQKSARVTHGQ